MKGSRKNRCHHKKKTTNPKNVLDFILPSAETPTGKNVVLLELAENRLAELITAVKRGRVAMLEAAIVLGDDVVRRLDELGVDGALDDLVHNCLVVYRAHLCFAHLEHKRPLLARLGDVVRRVLGEDGDAVKRTVVWRRREGTRKMSCGAIKTR